MSPHIQMVSGVFYVATPPNAAPILFRDPRYVFPRCQISKPATNPRFFGSSGPLPPFDVPLAIQPQAGDLLMFPSWLLHEVPATPGDEPRISIAFNMPGTWADTAGVAAQFPLER